MAGEKQDYGGLERQFDLSKLNVYGIEDERLKELRDAQQQAIEALQKRYAEPNWFKVAAGFAKPQLGGVIASLGSAAEAMGENVEQQRAQELPIAQLKLQMYQTNMIMGQNKKAADMVAERKRQGLPLTPEFAAEVARTAPDSAVAKALATEIATQQKEQDLALQRIQMARSMGIDPDPSDLAFLRRSTAPGSPPAEAPGAATPSAPGGAGPAVPSGATSAPATPAPPVAAAEPKKVSNITQQDFLKATYALEGTPPGKQVASSGATGPGGLIQSTKDYLQKKYNLPDGYGTDPSINFQYEAALLKENGAALSKNGLDNSALNHRMMWWFGSGDMPKLMKADPNTKIGDILSENVLKSNGLNRNTNVGKLISRVEGNLWDQGINPRSIVGESAARPAESALPDTSKATPDQFNQWGFANVPKNATFNEYTRKQWEEKEKEANVRLAPVKEFGRPEANLQFGQNIKQLLNFASESTENKQALQKVINNLNKYPPLVNALLHAGDQGFHASFNGTAASVGLPIKKFLENMNTPEEQKVAQMVVLAIDNANYVSAKMRGMSPTANIPAAEANLLAAGMLSRDLNLGTLIHSMSQIENNLEMYKNLYKGTQDLYNTYGDKLSPLAANYQIVNSKWYADTVKNYAKISDRYSFDYNRSLTPKKKKPNE